MSSSPSRPPQLTDLTADSEDREDREDGYGSDAEEEDGEEDSRLTDESVRDDWWPDHVLSVRGKVGIPNFVSGPREYIMEGEYVILAMCSWFRIS